MSTATAPGAERAQRLIFATSADALFSWARRSNLWWLQFGLACRGIKMIAAQMPRDDLAERCGMLYRASPRQADLMIVAGAITRKMVPVVRPYYDQLADPKRALSMGSCANVGGPFDTYAVAQGVDQIAPVDIYVPGCPPIPEALMPGVFELQNKVITYETLRAREGRVATERQRQAERPAARQAKTRGAA